ncbi:MAG: winged helix-turn-helix transcriptional regulator [Candidatus Altiarchaeota archaeon]
MDGLTFNEKRVLARLIDNARITDSEIAHQIRLSPAGVRKIRKKLEKDYIKEYRTILDYGKAGVNVIAICEMKVLSKDALKSPNIIGAFEINESDTSHILILGFPTLEELDSYKAKIHGMAEIRKIRVISHRGLLKNSPVELIKRNIR